jgi:hypothetical protein
MDGLFYLLDEVGNYITIDENEYEIMNKKELLKEIMQKADENTR